MSYIDSGVYNLATSGGQDAALKDIITELNKQYNQTTTLKSFSIAAFGKTTLVTTGAINTVVTKTVAHGLGFRPAFKVYLFNASANRYQPLIDGTAGIETSPKLDFLGPAWATSDTTNLNISILLNAVSIPDTVDFVYWIFNLSMPT